MSALQIPTLETERLILRAPAENDWPAYRAFLTGPRARFFGAPKTEAQARAVFDGLTGHWMSKGRGPFVMASAGRPIGAVGVSQPDFLPEPELVWSIWSDEDEGKGYVAEAAPIARAEHYLAVGESGVVSFIDPANTRSVAVATRLGARPDPETPAPFKGGITWRHPQIAPVILTTERLTLRTPEARDFDAFAAWVGSERSRMFGGPGPRHEAREGFGHMIDHWARHGFGYFHVEDTATGEAVGRIGISHPAHRAEPELAYALYEDRFEGRGIAFEAAKAVRDWAIGARALPSLVSYIAKGNDRSVALATRLGARPDGTTTARDGSTQQVFRHWPLGQDVKEAQA